MFYAKHVLVCSLVLSHVTLFAAVAPRAGSQWVICSNDPADFSNPVDVTPKWQLNNDDIPSVTTPPPKLSSARKADDNEVLKDSKLTVHGVCPIDSNGNHGVRINVEKMPIFDSEAKPGDPDTPLSDSNDFEHISLYFANEDIECDQTGFDNPCHRITEIRFNRFLQYNIRLLSRPYKVLKDSGFTRPEISTKANTDGTWDGDVTFEVDLLPKGLKYVAAFIIDPTQTSNITRYYSEYRLYNHPISVIDLQVVTSYKDLTSGQVGDKNLVDNIVRPEDNVNYSSHWDGL